MRDGEAPAQAREAPFVEDAADQAEVLVEHQLLAVGDREPGRFLAPVLEREQPERRELGRLLGGAVGQDDAVDAAHQPVPSRVRPAEPERPRQAVSPRVPRSVERNVHRIGDPGAAALGRACRAVPGELDDEPVTSDDARASTGSPCSRASSASAAAWRGRAVSDDPRGALAEQLHGRRPADGQSQSGAAAAPDRALGERDREAAAR